MANKETVTTDADVLEGYAALRDAVESDPSAENVAAVLIAEDAIDGELSSAQLSRVGELAASHSFVVGRTWRATTIEADTVKPGDYRLEGVVVPQAMLEDGSAENVGAQELVAAGLPVTFAATEGALIDGGLERPIGAVVPLLDAVLSEVFEGEGWEEGAFLHEAVSAEVPLTPAAALAQIVRIDIEAERAA